MLVISRTKPKSLEQSRLVDYRMAPFGCYAACPPEWLYDQSRSNAQQEDGQA